MKYDIHPISYMIVEIMGGKLVRDHKDEVSVMERKLDVDWDKYAALERAGKLLVLGAFVDDELVGYSANVVERNIHYELVAGYNCALFIHPDHRNSPLGLRLMAETRKGCAAWGATIMLWHAKPYSQLNTLLQRRRLEVQDIVYQEQL